MQLLRLPYKELRPGIVLSLLVAAIGLLTACERPFVEPRLPTIEVLHPDLTTVIPTEAIRLTVRADGFRTVESVTVDGKPFTFDESEQAWVQTIALRRGLNRLILSATDSDGQTVMDTAYAFQAALRSVDYAPALPDGRGGHTATRLGDGSILVIGGSSRYGTSARGDGAVLPSNAAQFRPMVEQMRAARVGHTATALPDGRVLIVGGSRHSLVRTVEDLIETVEIFDPSTERFTTIPYSGAPIRRAYHTAILRPHPDEIILDLFGGEGDIQYTPSPLLGTRNDIRSFELRNDSLVALSPAPGPNLGFSFAGHTQTSLRGGAPWKMLIAGTRTLEGSSRSFGAIVEYGIPNGLLPRTVGSMIVPRTHHAAEHVALGSVLIYGGREGPASTAVRDPEIYVEEAERFFRFPQSTGSARRFGLTATKFPDQRILFLGGFSPTGEGVATSDMLQLTTP